MANLPRAQDTDKKPTPAPPRVRSGGRSARIRRLVAECSLELLASGETDFGQGEVADRCGVSRATVYRWWPTRVDLLREALTLHTNKLATPNTGAWPDDLRALVVAMAAFFGDPIEMSLNAIMASGRQPDFDELMLTHYEPLLLEWKDVIYRAIARKEIPEDTSPDVIINMIVSPLLIPTLLLHRPATEREANGVVDIIERALRVPSSGAATERDRRGPHDGR